MPVSARGRALSEIIFLRHLVDFVAAGGSSHSPGGFSVTLLHEYMGIPWAYRTVIEQKICILIAPMITRA